MTLNKNQKILPFLLLLTFLTQIMMIKAQTPYSINVTPVSSEVEQGDLVTFSIEITADTGFEENIVLTLQVTVLTVTKTYELGTTEPPYPKTFEHTFTVPEEIPGGVTIEGTLTATSGENMAEEIVKIKIKGGNILENIINLIKQVINQIIDAITNLF